MERVAHLKTSLSFATWLVRGRGSQRYAVIDTVIRKRSRHPRLIWYFSCFEPAKSSSLSLSLIPIFLSPGIRAKPDLNPHSILLHRNHISHNFSFLRRRSNSPEIDPSFDVFSLFLVEILVWTRFGVVVPCPQLRTSSLQSTSPSSSSSPGFSWTDSSIE